MVNDLMNAEQVAGCFYNLIEEPLGEDEMIIEALAETEVLHSAVEAFEEARERLSVAARIKRVAKIRGQTVACIYTSVAI